MNTNIEMLEDEDVHMVADKLATAQGMVAYFMAHLPAQQMSTREAQSLLGENPPNNLAIPKETRRFWDRAESKRKLEIAVSMMQALKEHGYE